MQAAQQLREAANTMAHEPVALQLLYLQTLTEVAVEKNSTIIFPVPIDFLSALAGAMRGADSVEPPNLPR